MKRIQRKRVKGWTMPAGAVYVGRPTRWGNPFKDLDLQDSNPKAADEFDYWLHHRPAIHRERRQWILDHIDELRGKDLACWCKIGEPCHADVLLRLANDKEDGQ